MNGDSFLSFFHGFDWVSDFVRYEKRRKIAEIKFGAVVFFKIVGKFLVLILVVCYTRAVAIGSFRT